MSVVSCRRKTLFPSRAWATEHHTLSWLLACWHWLLAAACPPGPGPPLLSWCWHVPPPSSPASLCSTQSSPEGERDYHLPGVGAPGTSLSATFPLISYRLVPAFLFASLSATAQYIWLAVHCSGMWHYRVCINLLILPILVGKIKQISFFKPRESGELESV